MVFLLSKLTLSMNRLTHSALILAILLCSNCGSDSAPEKEQEEPLVFKNAFVVGFDQCAMYKGRILAIVEPKDTVITYNFPDSVYKFPDEYFSNYQFDCLFPGDVLGKFPVRVKYRPSKQEELTAHICFGDVYTARLSPLVKEKQVVIIAIEK